MNPMQLAMAFTLKEEGKFTIDDGGPTMHGVTQRVYDAYRLARMQSLTSVANITMTEVGDIMLAGYWVPAHCHAMPTPLAIATFDWSYNHGVGGAIETLQMCLGISIDGAYGPATAAAMKDAPTTLLQSFLDARRAWYKHAAAINPAKYGGDLAGWLNRVDQLETYLAGLT